MEYLTVSESIEHAVLVQYLEGKLSLEEACGRLSVHRTTLWRKLMRLEREGPLGLAHKLRGRPSNSTHALELKGSILKLYERGYKPFGFRVAHFYQEELEEKPDAPSYPSVLRWLKRSGLVEQSRKGARHHSRRPRREAFGEMIQMDTSIHDWLGWGKNLALVSNMDDCTNVLCGAYLAQTDTTLANMTVLKQTMAAYGLFASLYVDRSPVFKVTRTGGIGRIQQPTFQASYITQVQRALAELGIELIFAYSPQAKGRIERSYGTWQSRLIPELRKNGIREIDPANQYIREVFVPKHNGRFAQDPKRFPSVFVPIKGINLDYILAEKYRLTVGNDHVVSSRQAGLSLKVLPSPHRLSYAKAKVDVFKHTNGRVSVLYKGERLNFKNYAH